MQKYKKTEVLSNLQVLYLLLIWLILANTKLLANMTSPIERGSWSPFQAIPQVFDPRFWFWSCRRNVCVRKGFCRATLPHSSDMWRIWDCCHMQGVCRTWQIFLHFLQCCCMSRLNMLDSFLLLIHLTILKEHPVPGNVTVMPYFLHSIMAFLVLHGMSNVLEILLYLSSYWCLLSRRSLTLFVSSLWTMALAVRRNQEPRR